MRKFRFYQKEPLDIGNNYLLDKQNTYQITKVLRLKPKQEIDLFNNTPFEFKAIIKTINKNEVFVDIVEKIPNHKESPCKIHLLQAIAKGQKMDFIIQKAVELGAHSITPLITEHTVVNITHEKLNSRIEHWQKIIINACCQCGVSVLPKIHTPILFKEYLIQNKNLTNLILDPTSTLPITKITISQDLNLLIGPEGGFSNNEISLAKNCNCINVSLGPRILRAETASIVSIALLQAQFGDL